MAKDRDSTADRDRQDAAPVGDGVLLVTPLVREIPADVPRPGRFLGEFELHCALDGISALRILSQPELRTRIGIIVAEADLPDMTGLGLLQRAAALQPLAARVLLVDGPESVPAAEALPALGLADAWPPPRSLELLLERLHGERAALVRVHHLHCRLAAAASALERLESRFRSVRAAHDQLAASVRAVVGVAQDRSAHQQLDRWWRDYGDWLQLLEGRWPIHPAAMPLDQLLAGSLAELTAQGAGLACEAWLASRPRVPPHTVVQMDPVLARQMLTRLLLGLTELASRSASLGWELAAAVQQRQRLELRVSELRRGVDGSQLLEDPFARLPDRGLAFLSMDLVMAGALCRAQGGELRFESSGDGLVVELALPAPVAEVASGAPRDRAPQPVVPGGKGVL